MTSRRPTLFNARVKVASLALGAAACLSACATHHETASRQTTSSESQGSTSPALAAAILSLEGWQAETFDLPPGFAPGLPTGKESLRFSPGWRDPATEDFWSYAFVMWIDEPAPDAARIKSLLEEYYNGLMAAFAAGTEHDLSGAPAQVDVTRTAPNCYEARMRLIDAFATFKPIELRVLVDTAAESSSRSSLRIRVSPQPKEHAIWRSLDAAVAQIAASER